MFLDLLYGLLVRFFISINHTLLHQLIKHLNHIVLAVPMDSRVIHLHRRGRLPNFWGFVCIDLTDENASSVSGCGRGFTRHNVTLEVRIFASDFVDLVFRLVLQVECLVFIISLCWAVHCNIKFRHNERGVLFRVSRVREYNRSM